MTNVKTEFSKLMLKNVVVIVQYVMEGYVNPIRANVLMIHYVLHVEVGVSGVRRVTIVEDR